MIRQFDFRWINRVWLLLLAAACVVQFNDPDPWVWVAIYGIGLMTSVLYELDRLTSRSLRWGLGFAAVALIAAGSWRLLGLMTQGAPILLSEPGNEALGLMLVGAWIGTVVLVRSRRS